MASAFARDIDISEALIGVNFGWVAAGGGRGGGVLSSWNSGCTSGGGGGSGSGIFSRGGGPPVAPTALRRPAAVAEEALQQRPRAFETAQPRSSGSLARCQRRSRNPTAAAADTSVVLL